MLCRNSAKNSQHLWVWIIEDSLLSKLFSYPISRHHIPPPCSHDKWRHAFVTVVRYKNPTVEVWICMFHTSRLCTGLYRGVSSYIFWTLAFKRTNKQLKRKQKQSHDQAPVRPLQVPSYTSVLDWANTSRLRTSLTPVWIFLQAGKIIGIARCPSSLGMLFGPKPHNCSP